MLARRTVAKNTTRTAPAPHLGQEGNEHARTHVAIGPNPIESNREGNLEALGAIIGKGINQSVSQRASQARTRPLADGHPRTAAGAGPCGPPGRTCRPLRRRPLLPQPRRSPPLYPAGVVGGQCGEGERGRRDLCGAIEREKGEGEAIGGGSSP